MMCLVNDQGEVMNIVPDLLVVAPQKEAIAAVILQIVAGNGHGGLEVLVADGVAIGGQVFDLPVPDPLPHRGDGPWVYQIVKRSAKKRT